MKFNRMLAIAMLLGSAVAYGAAVMSEYKPQKNNVGWPVLEPRIQVPADTVQDKAVRSRPVSKTAHKPHSEKLSKQEIALGRSIEKLIRKYGLELFAKEAKPSVDAYSSQTTWDQSLVAPETGWLKPIERPSLPK